jgi:type II secretory pathway component PulC
LRIDLQALRRVAPMTALIAAAAATTWICFVSLLVRGTSAPALLATSPRPPATLSAQLDLPAFANSLQVIQSQSLVYSSRSFHAKPEKPVRTAPPRPDFRLAGVIILPRKPAVALLASNQGDETRRVKQGEDLGGWLVQSVDRRRVVFGWEDERFELTAQSALNAPAEAAPVMTTGLKRVPLGPRTAAAGAKGRVLGATGTPGGRGGPVELSNEPRLYRPPPAPPSPSIVRNESLESP